MKKIFSVLLVLLLAFGLIACSSGSGGGGNEDDNLKVGSLIVEEGAVSFSSDLGVTESDLDLSTAKVKIANQFAGLNEEITGVTAGEQELTVSVVKDGIEYYGTKTVTIEENEIITIKELMIDQSREYSPTGNTDVPAGHLRVHYQRNNDEYGAYTLWIWKDTTWSSDSDWPNGLDFAGRDEFGVYYDIPLKDGAQTIGFVPVDKEIGDPSKDGDDHIFNFVEDYKNVYTFEGDNTVYISPNKEVASGILSGEVVSPTEIKLSFTDAEKISKADLILTDKDGNEITIESYSAMDSRAGTIVANLDVETEAPYKISYDGKTVQADTGAKYEDSLTAYQGDDLGATYNSDGSATLKLWSPDATAVEVDVYDKDDQSSKVASTALTKGDNGVWSVTLDDSNVGISDLDGYFYQYRVTVDGKENKALDPYAKSMAEFKINTDATNRGSVDAVGKAAIIDPSSIGPNLDFANVSGYETREDAIIWEMHVRDFTSQPGLGLSNQFGTYEAFTEKLEYIKELGVTHIQLLPVMSYYFGDERKVDELEGQYSAKDNNYNWGYDPHSYFAPEGMYSKSPKDPKARVNELKTLIKAIHDQGMAVTLDVVYNHMAGTDILNRIHPDYYFRGTNGSGVGNDTASTHEMMRKLIVDSLVYWTEEYKVDGYRFDLMGLIDTQTIAEAYNKVSNINPDTLFIGEGWRMYTGPSGTQGADQDWMNKTNDVAVFSDEMRNKIKSGFGQSEGDPRFITGGEMSIATIFDNIKAQPGNTPADDPGDMVQYIAAHDNLTLHDVIAKAMKLDPSTASDEERIQKRIRLGNTMILTSQGIAFLHGGQEYGRTKEWKASGSPEGEDTYVDTTGDYYIHNSYDSSDAINMFDWDAVTNSGVQKKTMEYTKGLIALRKSTDAFTLETKAAVDSNVELVYPGEYVKDNIIAYKTQSAGNAYYVFINADTIEQDFSVAADLTAGTVLVDDDEAGVSAVTTVSGVEVNTDIVTLAPLTATVIKITQ